MNTNLEKVRATLQEELRLLGEMLILADETRGALINRSTDTLFNLGSRQQTFMVRLQIIQQTLQLLSRKMLEDVSSDSPTAKGSGLKKALRHLHADDELRMVEQVESCLLELAQKNQSNENLLDKQFQSLNAYQQLVDLVNGTEKVYDRSGSVSDVIPGQRLEHRG